MGLRWAAVSAFVLAVVGWVTLPLLVAKPVLGVANALVSIGLAATAAVMTGDPLQRRNGWLLWATTLFFTLGFVGSRKVGPLPLMEYVLGPLAFGTLLIVLLRYPEQRLSRNYERVFVAVALVLPSAIRCVSVLSSEPQERGHGPGTWWPTIWPTPWLVDLATTAYGAVGAALAVLSLPLIVRRVRRAAGIDRRVLLPVVLSASALGLIVACEAASRIFSIASSQFMVLLIIECLALLTIPTAFLVSAIRRRLSYAAIAGMVQALATRTTPDFVRSGLRESLHDPELEVGYWIPELNGYFDSEGSRLVPLAQSVDRFAEYVHASDGRPLVMVTVSSSLRRYPGLLDAAVSAARLALENGRLQAELRLQLQEVSESRARIVGAADAARRRMERDLHDGAQQRLLALKMRLAAARVDAPSEAERGLIDQTRQELQDALDELRALARGLHPAVLTQSGLGPAIRSVAERLPLATEVDIPDQRWAPTIEVTAYYVACEALANTVKHSCAQRATVSASREPDRLVLEVADDGAGGADIKEGGGLLGLRDRVAALGGDLTVVSPPGAGTRIIASIPCE